MVQKVDILVSKILKSLLEQDGKIFYVGSKLVFSVVVHDFVHCLLLLEHPSGHRTTPQLWGDVMLKMCGQGKELRC